MDSDPEQLWAYEVEAKTVSFLKLNCRGQALYTIQGLVTAALMWTKLHDVYAPASHTDNFEELETAYNQYVLNPRQDPN